MSPQNKAATMIRCWNPDAYTAMNDLGLSIKSKEYNTDEKVENMLIVMERTLVKYLGQGEVIEEYFSIRQKAGEMQPAYKQRYTRTQKAAKLYDMSPPTNAERVKSDCSIFFR